MLSVGKRLFFSLQRVNILSRALLFDFSTVTGSEDLRAYCERDSGTLKVETKKVIVGRGKVVSVFISSVKTCGIVEV